MSQGPAHPLDPAYVGDSHALLAAMRDGDDTLVAQAYRRVFGSPEGRLVLAHQAAEAGVGQIRPMGLPRDDRAMLDGQVNHALKILTLAGFDASSVAVMTMTDTLEGRDDERSSHPRTGAGADAGSYADPNPELEP